MQVLNKNLTYYKNIENFNKHEEWSLEFYNFYIAKFNSFQSKLIAIKVF